MNSVGYIVEKGAENIMLFCFFSLPAINTRTQKTSNMYLSLERFEVLPNWTADRSIVCAVHPLLGGGYCCERHAFVSCPPDSCLSLILAVSEKCRYSCGGLRSSLTSWGERDSRRHPNTCVTIFGALLSTAAVSTVQRPDAVYRAWNENTPSSVNGQSTTLIMSPRAGAPLVPNILGCKMLHLSDVPLTPHRHPKQARRISLFLRHQTNIHQPRHC